MTLVMAKPESVGSSSTISVEEWRVRVELAACYRLIAMFGWDDILATHISMRVPDRPTEFLINPFGMTFDEITATSLLKVGFDGTVIGDSSYGLNAAGFTIHSALHAAREDAHCVIHLHTLDGMAVSSLREGLMSFAQTAMLIVDDITYHDYEGVAVDLAERERLQRDLGHHCCMILRNHGTLAVGRTIPEAFIRIYHLERACTAQVRTLSMGRALHHPSEEARRRTSEVGRNLGDYGALAWPALLRRLNRILPGYDT